MKYWDYWGEIWMNYGKVIIDLLKQAGDTLDKNLRNHFCDFNLTVPQMSVLTILCQNGEMKISDISNRIGLSNSTTSGIIDRLEREGLVERVRSKRDRRVVKVGLTEKFNNAGRDFDLLLDDYFAVLFSKASEEDLKTVIKGFEIFNRILNSQI